MKQKVRIGDRLEFNDYESWLEEVKKRGADLLLEEHGATTYPNFIYASSEGKQRLQGNWSPTSGKGYVYEFLISFNTSRRKFLETRVAQKKGWVFKSSDGKKEYEVVQNEDSLKCTCPGFTFRGHCKHITKVSENLTN